MGYIPRVGPHPESATTETSPSSATTAPPKPTGPDLLIEVVATVVIRDFSKYYPGVPIDDFKPKYFPLADGSLVSPPLIKDLLQVHAVLIISTALFVFFFRNTFTVVRYIRSGQIPHKILFYILLGSQAIGFTFPLPTLISIFTQHVNCRIIEVLSTMTNFLSFSFLVTGILGVKAYRCLDKSKVVLTGLVLLQSASVALMITDVINLGAGRRLAGTCIRNTPMAYAVGTTASQFGELLFISCCFAWGFWQAGGSHPGRLTIPITPIPPDAPNRLTSEDSRRRGWWDPTPDNSSNIARSDGACSVLGGSIWHADQLTKQRKSSLRTAHPISQPNNPRHIGKLSTYALSIAASSFISKFGPRVKTFQTLLRNELAFTSAITLLQGVTSVLAAVNMNPDSFFPAYCLSMTTWVIISQLLLSTFDRVIRRHEKEAMLQNPDTWGTARREVRGAFRVPTSQGGSSLWGSGNLMFPDNATHRSAESSSSILSDPFKSRPSSRASRMRSKSHTGREPLSRLDPMREEPTPGASLPTASPSLRQSDSPVSSPVSPSPRSPVAPNTHMLPR